MSFKRKVKALAWLLNTWLNLHPQKTDMIGGIENKICEVFQHEYAVLPELKNIQIQQTRKEFEGDFTFLKNV